ncbi:hypothetical protein A3D71_00690 [Candidatus Kaiserbacteria bacterium RIFCSPHIGHO2_02_FULL_55_20]|uniref:homoserine dehydrogenase n=1 Tax=Candidatus Kaiserbacteria bacterium RIFCSPHIGHO2_02_FULL_55_20 TaxID=1798497 RepID=A0A1F6DY00_9BACT|nr:MAG: hypothetical protein A2680_00740 [Candidatus Kaiserbacteria bacterium RIFCSPHIGHO2_01_FULL_55_37]OGG65872.1 MAG: hypothetical protein A3D71_00690 [Candidatus Kaiserbacteria bacterium RIFCSPHIGHO2_02_FULL_55_20]
MKIILIGSGNVGGEVEKVLAENNIPADFVIRSSGVYSKGSHIDTNDNFAKYVDDASVVFISVPSRGDGSEMLHYYVGSFKAGARIVTCEKAVLAHHFELVQKFKERIRYSATVGGNSGILPAVSDYRGAIMEIRAVINGTLNYVSGALSQKRGEDDIFHDVVSRGFTDPGPRNLQEVFQNELKDVAYKTAILANHSGLYEKRVTPDDVQVEPYKERARCAVVLNKERIQAGFLSFEDTSWFPAGVNNCICINGVKVAEGPGAGGRATAERMFSDFQMLARV